MHLLVLVATSPSAAVELFDSFDDGSYVDADPVDWNSPTTLCYENRRVVDGDLRIWNPGPTNARFGASELIGGDVSVRARYRLVGGSERSWLAVGAKWPSCDQGYMAFVRRNGEATLQRFEANADLVSFHGGTDPLARPTPTTCSKSMSTPMGSSSSTSGSRVRSGRAFR